MLHHGEGFRLERLPVGILIHRADALLYGRVPGGASLVVRVEGAALHKAGETLRFAVLPRNVHLFEPKNARRIAA